MMIPETRQRLEAALADLQSFVVGGPVGGWVGAPAASSLGTWDKGRRRSPGDCCVTGDWRIRVSLASGCCHAVAVLPGRTGQGA